MVDVDLDAVRRRLGRDGLPIQALDVAEVLRQLGYLVSDALVRNTMAALRQDSSGAGPLDPILAMANVTDVLVNGAEQLFIDRGHGLERLDSVFIDEAQVRRLAVRLAAMVGRRLDEGSPFVDARLPNGIRVHAVLPTLASPGTCISLRVPARTAFTLDDWVVRGSLSGIGARMLRDIVASRAAFLISGGTGTGKTTLMATMLALVPPDERLVVVEDSRELNPDHPHVVRLEARLANAEGAGRVTMADLVRQALRMRPDRLVIGEVRGAELCDLLMALNTGHEGGCGTVHANSAADVPARLEALAALGGMGRAAAHAHMASALHVVVHIRRREDGVRRVSSIGVIVPDRQTGLVQVVNAVTFTRAGEAVDGPARSALDRMLTSPEPGAEP